MMRWSGMGLGIRSSRRPEPCYMAILCMQPASPGQTRGSGRRATSLASVPGCGPGIRIDHLPLSLVRRLFFFSLSVTPSCMHARMCPLRGISLAHPHAHPHTHDDDHTHRPSRLLATDDGMPLFSLSPPHPGTRRPSRALPAIPSWVFVKGPVPCALCPVLSCLLGPASCCLDFVPPEKSLEMWSVNKTDRGDE